MISLNILAISYVLLYFRSLSFYFCEDINFLKFFIIFLLITIKYIYNYFKGIIEILITSFSISVFMEYPIEI